MTEHAADFAPDALWRHFGRPGIPTESIGPLVRGEGCYVWDSAGRRYLDATSGLYCVSLGYGRQELVTAAQEQMRKLPYANPFRFDSEAALALATEMVARGPENMGAAFLTSGGSEAVESAIKLARLYHVLNGDAERYKIVSRRGAYHGMTLGALGAGGIHMRTHMSPLITGFAHGAMHNCAMCEYQSAYPTCGLSCAWDLERVIDFEGPETVAAVLLEPISENGGCMPPQPGYWECVTEICRQNGVLLILDEVITGYGRLGSMMGSTLYGLQPDLITVGKGLSSGYFPIGGVLASTAIADFFRQKEALFHHGFTFGSHPVGAAVALKVLQLLDQDGIVDEVNQHASYLEERLAWLQKRHDSMGSVQGKGYLWGAKVVASRQEGREIPLHQWLELKPRLSAALLEHGVICPLVEGMIEVVPPLIAGRAEIDAVVDALDAVFTSLVDPLTPGM